MRLWKLVVHAVDDDRIGFERAGCVADATYEINGRQFIVVATSADPIRRRRETPVRSSWRIAPSYVAFALPAGLK